jgi:N-acetyl-gamma-glutamyl-phosphate reductase
MHNYVPSNSAISIEKSPKKVTASVVGARGYTGLELVKILFQHPLVKLTHCFATAAFKLSDDIFESQAEDVICLPDSELFQNLTDIIFLATPADVSMKLAPKLVEQGKIVIDLSGAFRLKNNDYAKWYHAEHSEKALLAQAHYGLVPFAGPVVKDAKLISNPGCYATAIAMALIPLVQKKLINVDSLVIDAKSGTTGAGKKAAENILFSEVDGECLPYRVGRHQHLPEIQEAVENFGGQKMNPHFATHLLPTKRGIIASIYAQTTAKDVSEITKAYEAAFKDYPLVRFGTQISKLASLNKVTHTPYTHISYELVGDKLYVFSCIDNLLKGAASQAVENLNRTMDWPVHLGLTNSPREVAQATDQKQELL